MNIARKADVDPRVRPEEISETVPIGGGILPKNTLARPRMRTDRTMLNNGNEALI
jgi:hypothetical protein